MKKAEPKAIEVYIHKPLYSIESGDYCGVYDKHILNGIEWGRPLMVSTDNGSALFDPKWVRDNCEIIEKTFLRPNEPMKLFKLFIPRRPTEKERSDELIKQGKI